MTAVDPKGGRAGWRSRRSGSLVRIAAAAGALVAASASADWTASGRFEYTDRLYDATGFTGTTPAPVREADVQVYDLQTLVVLASGATDAAGDFSIAVVDASTRDVGVRVLSSTNETPSLDFEIADSSFGNPVFVYHDAATDQSSHGPADDVDFGTMTMPAAIGNVATTDWSSQVFNLFDMALLASDWVAAVDGARPNGGVQLRFNPTSGSSASYYVGTTNRLFVADDDGYDDPNVLHELGHWIEDELGASQSPGGAHTIGDDDQDPRLAWSEGFATYFSSTVLELAGRPRPDLYSDRDSFGVGGGGGFAFTVEVNAVGGSTSEVAVAGALWDMVDSASTQDLFAGSDDDPLSASDPGIWQVVEALRVAALPATQLEDFWDLWQDLGLPGGPSLDGLMGQHSIDFVPDAQEPNDDLSTATLLTVGGAWQENTFYDAGSSAGGDEDWFRFAAVAGNDYRVEIGGVADTVFGRPDPEMFLFDPDHALLAYADDPRDLIPNDPGSSFTQEMAETVPSILFRAQTTGEHRVYVRHRSAPLNLGGRYGTYPIRVVPESPLAPVIGEVAGQRMRPGERYPLLVHGADLYADATLSFSDPGIVVERLEWLAPTTLFAEVTVGPGVLPGSHDATVTNPGGASATLFGAVLVGVTAPPPIAISEVDPDSNRVEIHNRGQSTANLTNWQIVGYWSVGTAATSVYTFPSFSLGPDARVVVHDIWGTDTATELYDTTYAVSWGWVAANGGGLSLVDATARNVDFIRFVDSYVDDHEGPVGLAGGWMQPEQLAPAAGYTLSRADTGARARTRHGLAASVPTLPVGAIGRENAVDGWEDNDAPRLAIPLSRSGSLDGLAIHPRPGGEPEDEDWFGVVLAAGQALTIEADFPHVDGDLDLEVFAPGVEPAGGGVPILSASTTTDDEVATITTALTSLHGSGLYRFRIFGVDGATNDYSLLRSVPEVCGNGELTAGEECDDGNLLDGDCCSGICTIEVLGTVCRAAVGDCDLEEQCDGVSPVCPADLKSSAVCRAAAGGCDVEESCDGVADDCPVDDVLPAATVCRAAAGECDVEEVCDGVASGCPVDLKSTAACRAAVGVCDVTESCDGVADECPADLFEPDTTVCRASVGVCDVDELCTGVSPVCPADLDLDGQSCSDGDLCNGEEICLGTVCDVGASLDCDDLDACTADSCDAVLGCRNEPIPGCTAVPLGGAFLRLALVLVLVAAGALALDRRG